jgi:hypothetical protein
MKRREFIWTAVAALGATMVGLLTLDFHQVCRAMLLEDIARIRIKPESVDLFIEEADNECFWERFTWRKRLFIVVQHAAIQFGIRLPYYQKYLQTRDLVTGTYLMSTDFFFANLSNHEVNYLGYHNPYKTSCSNPFSSLWVSEATTMGGWNSVTTTTRSAVARHPR